jgi:hypothetical protein
MERLRSPVGSGVAETSRRWRDRLSFDPGAFTQCRAVAVFDTGKLCVAAGATIAARPQSYANRFFRGAAIIASPVS